jgi:hypothetical protein
MAKTKSGALAGCVLAATLLVVAVTTSPAGAQPVQTQSQANNGGDLDAQQIYNTGNVTVDPDVKTLVITIPDNAGTDRSVWDGFLPSHATVALGTVVVLLNADVNATHIITVTNDGTGQSTTDLIPYQNTSAYRLDAPGDYTLTDQAAGIRGTVSVVENATLADNPVTDATRPAVGLFIAPTDSYSDFESHLNTLGFNAVSSHNFTATQQSAEAGQGSANGTPESGNENMTLFVWTQQVSHPNTIDGRLASKVRTLEGLLYPDEMVKQGSTN